MMNQLVGMYNTEVKRAKSVKGTKMKFPKTAVIDGKLTILPTVDPSKLSWGKFKKYCKGKGLNVVGKKKVELLKELGL